MFPFKAERRAFTHGSQWILCLQSVNRPVAGARAMPSRYTS
ncbi:hypothetical protein SAMN04488061_3009 [Filomicrobium insigne]|uniref:Transposase n=1 Tax=Filomicrobium insigne TaxID=418854 RepID=A0A1H0SR84_9HYPH|nr:hypothetical protein SAMN04488061_3009 [Filomicrobium insigne]